MLSSNAASMFPDPMPTSRRWALPFWRASPIVVGSAKVKVVVMHAPNS